MRVLLIGGGHSAYFAAKAIRRIDPGGKLIIIEFTSEKVAVLSKIFPRAEIIQVDIDEVEDYVKSNGSILDAVIAATESDSLNLRYCKASKESDIPLTISIINNPLNTKTFLKEGITYVVSPCNMISIELSEILDAKVNMLYRFQKTRVQVASMKINDKQILFHLKRLAALFISPTGEVMNSIEEVSVRWRVYMVGSEEKVRGVLKAVEG